MGLETTFRDLTRQWDDCRKRLRELSLAIDDRPAAGHVLVDELSDATQDMLGWVEEASDTATKVADALADTLDVDQARRGLARCQSLEQRVSARWTELVGRRSDLDSLARRKRGPWPGWSTVVAGSTEQLAVSLAQVRAALAACWQELAERVGMTHVSVRNVNHGPQVISAAHGRESD